MNQLIRDKGRLAKIVLTFSFLVYLYDRLTKPPKNLRHIPRWSIFSFFSLLRKFDTTAEAKKISQDVLKKSGYKGLCLVNEIQQGCVHN
jgi:hypothetical protein